MSVYSRLSNALDNAMVVPFDHQSKFVFMSDCHRGDGSWGDNFMKNQTIYYAALKHYYQQGYTYFELGDGDELWENANFNQIASIHSDVFGLLSRLYRDKRFYMIYGNHDITKRKLSYIHPQCCEYYDELERRLYPLFPDIEIPESILLRDESRDRQILLAHGHQGDLINDTLWRVSRFLIRHIWKPLELIGIKDPTSTARNYSKTVRVERRLKKFCEKKNQMLIAGHTHRPVFPKPGSIPYFNDGSCVHPRCITAIEIKNGNIRLVKWMVHTRDDRGLYVEKEIIAGPVALDKYF